MRIVVKEPNEKPYVRDIKEDLKEYQKIVGGYIEAVPLFPGVLFICNEEGKLQGLPYNFGFCGDIIVGTVFFVGSGQNDFRGLTNRELDDVMAFMAWFN